MIDIKNKIKKYLVKKDNKFNSIFEINKMSGGSSNEIWIIQYLENKIENKIVLRRHHSSISEKENLYPPLPLTIESDVMVQAYNQKIPVPRIIYNIDKKHALGEGFFMEFIDGITLGNKIVENSSIKLLKPNLAAQCGKILAKIHSITIQNMKNLNTSTGIDEIKKYKDIYQDYSFNIPVFNLSFKWLEKNIPPVTNKCLVHGDYRNGNIVISPSKGIKSILDWELLHLGDRHEDLAWICVNSWRFGNIKLPVGGFGLRNDFYKAYEQSSGEKLNKESLKFWEILGTLKWGIMCLKMYDAYKSGYDRSVDRAAIGRRSSETEIDLLRLLNNEDRYE